MASGLCMRGCPYENGRIDEKCERKPANLHTALLLAMMEIERNGLTNVFDFMYGACVPGSRVPGGLLRFG